MVGKKMQYIVKSIKKAKKYCGAAFNASGKEKIKSSWI